MKKTILGKFLPLAIVATLLSAAIYLAVQQDLRQSANDPQIQIAQDAAAALDQGQMPEQVIPPTSLDVSKSLAPFVIIYDRNNQVVASSGQLGNQVPSLPAGVLAYTSLHGQDQLTWQPQPGLRLATIVVRGASGSLVLAARSLREVEKREDQLGNEIIWAWLITMAATLISLAILPDGTKK